MPRSLHLSCGSKLTRQGISLSQHYYNYDRYSLEFRSPTPLSLGHRLFWSFGTGHMSVPIQCPDRCASRSKLTRQAILLSQHYYSYNRYSLEFRSPAPLSLGHQLSWSFGTGYMSIPIQGLTILQRPVFFGKQFPRPDHSDPLCKKSFSRRIFFFHTIQRSRFNR